jgi:hypothetical protein
LETLPGSAVLTGRVAPCRPGTVTTRRPGHRNGGETLASYEQAAMDDRDRGRRDLVGMRRARWIAWSACVLTWGLGALGLVLWAFNRSHPQLGAVVEIVSFQAVGLLILARRPNNRIGWIFCTISLLDALWVFTTQYATYALVTKPAALVGASGAAWLSSWMWAPPLWLT